MTTINGTIASGNVFGREVSFFVANSNDVIQQHHLGGTFYEMEELGIISEFFPRGGVLADIGANVGNHTVFVGCFLHPRQIVLFEPNPVAIPVLRANVALNGLQATVDTTYLGCGLGDTEAWAETFVPQERNLGSTRLNVGQGQTIRVVPGDTALAGRRVDFIKLDVEGMEMQVLQGLSQTIATQRPAIFVEIDQIYDAAFAQWLASMDYVVCKQFKRYPPLTNYMIMPVERAGEAPTAA